MREVLWNWGLGGWPAAFALAVRGSLLSSEAWRRGNLASPPGCLLGDRGCGQGLMW